MCFPFTILITKETLISLNVILNQCFDKPRLPNSKSNGFNEILMVYPFPANDFSLVTSTLRTQNASWVPQHAL